MFPGMDFVRESAGTLIPTRFVWPYGGRSVYLSGSFTGWTDHLQMTPVEGCPTVYQTICSLPPGFHQYKFIVDGEWRHDEHQPCVSRSYGTVNTVVLARESDYSSPTVLPPQTPSASSMDVDNDTFQRVVRVTDGSLHEAMPRISEADVQISRHRISGFLSTRRAYELMPDSGKVIALDVDLPVKQAFHILHEQGVPIAPLWDFSRGKFVGILSALDFILILRELGNHGSNLTEEELETHTISAWKEAKSYLSRQNNEHAAPFPTPLVQAGPDENMKDVALKILRTGVAIVPIIQSSSQEGSAQLLHLASLSDILRSICRYFRHSSGSLPILQLPICAIPLGTWVPKIGEINIRPLATLRPSAPLSAALALLVQAQVSSIPIVDDNDSLLDLYSRSDITSLAKNKLYTHINLDETSIHQALQLGQEPFSPFGVSSQRCHMCLRSDSLHKVMERLSKPGVRRLVIVEAGSKRVEGIVSLSDVFRFLLG
jgi:CBS domain-containing protein